MSVCVCMCACAYLCVGWCGQCTCHSGCVEVWGGHLLPCLWQVFTLQMPLFFLPLPPVLTLGYWDVVPDLALYSLETRNSGPHTWVTVTCALSIAQIWLYFMIFFWSFFSWILHIFYHIYKLFLEEYAPLANYFKVHIPHFYLLSDFLMSLMNNFNFNAVHNKSTLYFPLLLGFKIYFSIN